MAQRKSVYFAVGVFLALALLLRFVALSGFALEGIEEDPIVIGATFPLTGELSVYGEGYQNGAILAMEKINQLGGINGKSLKIEFHDNQGIAKNAVSDVMYLVNVRRVPIVLNSMEYLTLASKDITEQNKIIMLTFTTYKLSDKDNSQYLYKDSWDFESVGEGLGKAAEDAGFGNLAVVRLKDSSYSDLESSFFKFYKGDVVIDESYNFGEKDFRSILAKVKESEANTILIYSYPVDMSLILNQMSELGMYDYNLVLTEGTEQYVMASNINLLQATHAISYYGSELQDPSWFVDEYKSKFGVVPRPESYYSYDSVMMFADAIAVCGEDTDCIRQEIYFNFDEFHNRKRELSIVQYDNGWKEV